MSGPPLIPDRQTGLSLRESRFVDAVVAGKSAAEAAYIAGYRAKHSPKYAYRILHKPHIQAEIARRAEKVEEKANVDAARVLQELARVALADPRKLFDAHGNLKPITDWTEEDAACVASVDVVKRNLTAGDGQTDTVLKIRMWDKPKGLELLAKHFGMLTEKLEIKGDADLVSRLTAARQRRIAVAIQED